MPKSPYITSQQSKWFKSIQDGLERDTGKSLEQWIIIAKSCPETKKRARLNWFKSEHNLGLNRASIILAAAFETGISWSNPEALLVHLWKTPETRAVYDRIETIAKNLGNDVVIGPRKGFSAFSRRYQFAALRPTRAGIRLGLAIPFGETSNPVPPLSSDSWSDRLTTVQLIENTDDIGVNTRDWLQWAYDLSN